MNGVGNREVADFEQTPPYAAECRCERAHRRPEGPRGGSVPLEPLNFAFVLFGGAAGVERAEIAAATGFGILLARVEPVLARGEFTNHGAHLLGTTSSKRTRRNCRLGRAEKTVARGVTTTLNDRVNEP